MQCTDLLRRSGTAFVLVGLAMLAVACDRHASAPGSSAQASTPAMTFTFEQPATSTGGLPDGFVWHDRTPTATAVLVPDGHGGKSSLKLGNSTVGAAASVVESVSPRFWREGSVVRVRGWLRTDDVKAGISGFPGTAGFVLRADGTEPVSAEGKATGQRSRPLAMVNNLESGPSGTSGWQPYELMIRVPQGTRHLLFGVALAGTGSVWVDDIVLFTDDALAPASSSALAYGNRVLDIMQARGYHGARVDWAALRTELPRALAGTRTPEDILAALRPVIQRAEPHSDLISSQMAAAASGDAAEASRMPPLVLPVGRLIDDRFGYLTVPAYGGDAPARMTRFADALQGTLAGFDDAGVCGYIVDFRENIGGNMYPMIAGIGPLLGTDRPGSFVDRHGAPRGQWFYRDGGAYVVEGGKKSPVAVVDHPRSLRSADAPVAVLIGARTVSSGEAAVVSFLGRPATRLFGEPSEGLTTGNEPVRLADGAFLVLTEVAMVDRTGKVHDGPIVPDEVVPPGKPVGSPAEDPVVRRAAAWLAGQAACRR